MFTIKLYDANNFRQRILEAESFSILRFEKAGPDGPAPHAEITVHRSDVQSERCDIYSTSVLTEPHGYEGPERFAKAIIENRFGKTTEIIFAPGSGILHAA